MAARHAPHSASSIVQYHFGVERERAYRTPYANTPYIPQTTLRTKTLPIQLSQNLPQALHSARAPPRHAPEIGERAEREGVEEARNEAEDDGEADEAPVPVAEAAGEDAHAHVQEDHELRQGGQRREDVLGRDLAKDRKQHQQV